MLRLLGFTFLLVFRVYADDTAPLRTALEKQSRHESITVKVRQTKKTPALKDDIQTPGRLWLVTGKAFRWELGSPKKQTVVYDGTHVFVLDEVKKTGKRLTPDHRSVKPLFLTLGMGKDAGFDGLTRLFTIASTNQEKGRYIAVLTPRKRELKRAMSSLIMQINLKASFPERIGWVQRDGTEVMTEFYKPTFNPSIPASVFQITESDYTWQ